MSDWLSVGCRSQKCESFPLLSSLNHRFWPEEAGRISSVIQARHHVIHVMDLLMVHKTKVRKDGLYL